MILWNFFPTSKPFGLTIKARCFYISTYPSFISIMSTIRKDNVIASTALGNTAPGIVLLPQLRAMANAPVDHSFFEAKGFPQSSLDNYTNLEPTLFSHPYLYWLSWGHKVIHFFCKSNIQYQCQEPSLHYDVVDMMDYQKTATHAPVIGQMYWLGSKVHEDKTVNVEGQQKEIVPGFLDCNDTGYNGILDALEAGIYIRATVHAMEMMRSGSTSSRVVMGLVHCTIVDSDADSEIEAYPENW